MIFFFSKKMCVGHTHASGCASKDATFLRTANMTYCDWHIINMVLVIDTIIQQVMSTVLKNVVSIVLLQSFICKLILSWFFKLKVFFSSCRSFILGVFDCSFD